ncbi:tail fiber domain-containing protein [bacterium]|nr:tail fiber domain-containing protein [bacterium]NDD85184.1 tail fiber domain-containing protein [bacterium]NDG19115.1 tail fiber domain-containing protein [Betaproteobacteria bacterium]
MLKTVSSITNAIGALNYKGTWNASTNSPTLASNAGTKGDYYVVSVSGTTSLNGISNWGVGDWVTFNGAVWQRVEGGADGNFVNLTATGLSQTAELRSTRAVNTDYVTRSVNTQASGDVYTYYSSIESNGNSTNSRHFTAVTQGVAAWFLYGNGTTSFTSDERLKRDIETTRDGYLQDISKIRIVKYKWKNGPDNAHKELGWIAQEVEQVFPGLVQEEELENGASFKVVKSSVFVPILLKCVQELKAEIDSLKSEIATIKGV